MEHKQNFVSGLHHVAIRAIDFDQTLHFYIHGLGYKLRHEWSLPEFNLRRAAILESPDGGSFLKIFYHQADIAAQGRKKRANEPYVQTALLHMCLSVTDASVAYKAALDAGATSCIPPSTLQLGEPAVTVHNALVYSPNGEVIEFLQQGSF